MACLKEKAKEKYLQYILDEYWRFVFNSSCQMAKISSCMTTKWLVLCLCVV